MMYKYLPIGSVVLIKDSKKRVMICGIKQKQPDSEKVWDYSGCIYPQGVQDSQKLFLFDNDQLEMLYFVGFQDGEALQFLKDLETDA